MKLSKKYVLLYTLNLSIGLQGSTYQDPYAKIKTAQLKQCNICLDEKNRNDFRQLHCKHDFCKDCLQEMIDMAIREKNTEALKCPNPNCGEKLTQEDIKNVNNNQAHVDAITDIMAMEFLATLPHAKHCPTPNCNYVFINEQGHRQTITCPSCHKEYCSHCLLKHNQTISCQQAKAALNPTEEEAATREFMAKNNIKPCPQCGQRIEKVQGCSHVQCKNCRKDFCFNCYGNHGHVGRCPNPARYLDAIEPKTLNPIQAPKAAQPQPKQAIALKPKQQAEAQQRENFMQAQEALLRVRNQEALRQQLHNAILEDSAEQIRELIPLLRATYGANENPLELIHYTSERKKPLERAIQLAKPHATEALLEFGINPNYFISIHNPGNTRPEHYSLLVYALNNGDIRTALSLIRAGANFSTDFNNASIMDLLFNHIEGNTALAIRFIQELIDRGYNIHNPGRTVHTHRGAVITEKSIWELVLQREPLRNLQNMFAFLVANDCDINQHIYESRRGAQVVPLFFALQTNNVEAVELLLNAGANPDELVYIEERGPNLRQISLREYARREGIHPDIVRLLNNAPRNPIEPVRV